MESRREQAGPLRILVRVIAGLAVLLLVVVVLGFVWFLAASLTSVVLRVLVGSVLALLVAWFGIGYFRQLKYPPPPEPEPLEVSPAFRLAYVCEMCGLEVAVLKVAREKPPKHCGEEMVLIRKHAGPGD